MGMEIELKYRASEAQLAALEGAFPGSFRTVRMHTRYYDTPDRAFSRQKLTLRCRLENGSPVCTLKTPAGPLARGEFELPGSDMEAAAVELCKLAGLSRLLPLPEGGLEEVCGARFTRKALELHFPEFTAELALDLGVLTGGGRELSLSEAELELKSGSQEALLAFGQQLESRFGLIPENKSKFRRALDLAKEV